MGEEMHIPDAEELEWLENVDVLPEYDEEEFLIIEVGAGGEAGNLATPTRELLHPQESQITRKRIFSEENVGSPDREESTPGNSGGRKRRALGKEQEEDEEKEKDKDWLRYSPRPLPKVSDVHAASPGDDPMVEAHVEEKILFRFAVDIEGDCIPVTGPSGDRVYAKMQSRKIIGEGSKKLSTGKSKDGLLSEPISAIIKKLDQEAFAKVFEENDKSPSHPTHEAMPTMSEQPWVEKYAPCSFMELLSDEQTNREVLLWLKQWDSCVFGSQIRATTSDVLSALRSHSVIQYQKFSDRKSFFKKNEGAPSCSGLLRSLNALDRQVDNLNGVSESWGKTVVDNHPEQKVLLLCGPPGLGKTTLAHVAAKHCGYRVVEINASDDRSSSAIESKVLNAVEMRSLRADSKPNCLVIDEIDGALGEGKGVVEVLVKMVSADKKIKTEKGNSTQQALSEKVSSKKGHKSAALLRPIICICNDLYAPALRPLRQIAKVHMFVQPTISRVVNRLKYICKKEEFKTNSIALAALAECTECDIRSCLNTLQFLNKKKETLNILEVGSQVVGRKDISKTSVDIWKAIFQKRKSKHEKRSADNSICHGDFEFMYSLMSNRGDHDLTMDGIHENFLKLSYHDPMMVKTVRCLDLLGVSDLLNKYTMRTQQMSLHAYQPAIAIFISRLIAQIERPNIEWPKSFQRCRAMLMEMKDLLKLWRNKISPIISRHLSNEYFSEDFVSSFLRILAPPNLKPVALHLFSEREKDALAQLVDVMVSYSITYKYCKAENLPGPHNHGTIFDAPVLLLDPPIDGFINFKDYQSAHLTLSLAMKQVLLHEVVKQRILHESFGRSLNLIDENDNSRPSTIANSKVYKSASAEGRDEHRAEIHQLQKEDNRQNTNSKTKSTTSTSIAAKAIGEKKSSTSFFDRFRKGNSLESKVTADSLKRSATAERDSRPFLFKYNEGFTNAVKRPVKIRELLL